MTASKKILCPTYTCSNYWYRWSQLTQRLSSSWKPFHFTALLTSYWIDFLAYSTINIPDFIWLIHYSYIFHSVHQLFKCFKFVLHHHPLCFKLFYYIFFMDLYFYFLFFLSLIICYHFFQMMFIFVLKFYCRFDFFSKFQESL